MSSVPLAWEWMLVMGCKSLLAGTLPSGRQMGWSWCRCGSLRLTAAEPIAHDASPNLSEVRPVHLESLNCGGIQFRSAERYEHQSSSRTFQKCEVDAKVGHREAGAHSGYLQANCTVLQQLTLVSRL